MSRRACVLAALAMAVLAAGCAPGKPPGPGGRAGETVPIGDTLRLTIVPYEAADRLNDDYTPMADYLAHRLGKKQGKFMSVVDYSGVLAALESGQVDVAYLSSFPYALATKRMTLQPLAMPWVLGNLMYHGIIFVRADSPIRTVQDLKGKTFAFADPSSTSGYLLPRALLEKAGVFAQLKGWRNVGNPNVVVKAVENGAADAGSAYGDVFMVAYRGEPEKAKGMRVIARTEEIPNGIYVARGNMPPAQVEQLKQAFLAMNDPANKDGHAAMLKAPNDKIVPADDHLFDHVRETARILNLDLSTFEKKGK